MSPLGTKTNREGDDVSNLYCNLSEKSVDLFTESRPSIALRRLQKAHRQSVRQLKPTRSEIMLSQSSGTESKPGRKTNCAKEFVQKQFLESAFLMLEASNKKNPTIDDLRQIAMLTQLSLEKVYSWFQKVQRRNLETSNKSIKEAEP